ncbi:MAG TPA: hypothetical protein VH084_27785 [Mycobacterium sp.]|nr:hypothetical protein [Mycobacterium sp.]
MTTGRGQQQLPGHRAERRAGQHPACRDLGRGGDPEYGEELPPAQD